MLAMDQLQNMYCQLLVERFELKKINFKNELNNLVDDLFGFLLTEVSTCLLQPSATPPTIQQNYFHHETQLDALSTTEQIVVKNESDRDPEEVTIMPSVSSGVILINTTSVAATTSATSSAPVDNEKTNQDEPIFNDNDDADEHNEVNSNCSCDNCFSWHKNQSAHETSSSDHSPLSTTTNKRHKTTNSVNIQSRSNNCKTIQTVTNSNQTDSQTPNGAKFRCPECGIYIAYRSRYRLHLRTHSNIRPYRCKFIGCNAGFTQSGATIQHIRTQHFNLPRTVREQNELGIDDDRDPHQFMEVIEGFL